MVETKPRFKKLEEDEKDFKGEKIVDLIEKV